MLDAEVIAIVCIFVIGPPVAELDSGGKEFGKAVIGVGEHEVIHALVARVEITIFGIVKSAAGIE